MTFKTCLIEFLRRQLVQIDQYRADVQREIDTSPNGSARMEKYKALIIRDYLTLLMEGIQEDNAF